VIRRALDHSAAAPGNDLLRIFKSRGSAMAIPDQTEQQQPPPSPNPSQRGETDYCIASGLRRKFLDYCYENPGAEECRIYDV
jgi:hypothetical protein